MDAEIVVGLDDRLNVQSIPAVLFHYVPPETADPTSESFHFVHGKFSSMEGNVLHAHHTNSSFLRTLPHVNN